MRHNRRWRTRGALAVPKPRCFHCGDRLPRYHEAHVLRSGEVLPCCGCIECDAALFWRIAADIPASSPVALAALADAMYAAIVEERA